MELLIAAVGVLHGKAAGGGVRVAFDSAAEEVRKALDPIMQRFGPEYWRGQDALKTFPTEFFDTIGEAGYFGTFIPEAYGGVDAGARIASVLVEEINRAGGDASSVNAQMAICRTLVLHGTEEQKQKYLPGVASGDIRFLTVAATEPDSGANMNDLTSTARRDGDKCCAWPGYHRSQCARRLSSPHRFRRAGSHRLRGFRLRGARKSSS